MVYIFRIELNDDHKIEDSATLQVKHLCDAHGSLGLDWHVTGISKDLSGVNLKRFFAIIYDPNNKRLYYMNVRFSSDVDVTVAVLLYN